MSPESSIVTCASHIAEERPFNKPAVHGISSPKTTLARSLKLMKTGNTSILQIKVTGDIYKKLQIKAAAYHVSLHELCLCGIGYHAALWRQKVAKSRAKNPFEKFELKLRNDFKIAR